MSERKARLVAATAAAGLAFACGDEVPAGGCLATPDCPEGQVCVYLGARARSGACVEPVVGPGFPGDVGPWPTALDLDNELDVLFVVDDSPAIAPRLPQLAEGVAALAGRLLAASPRPSLRFAVTSTDAGNPRCTSTPDLGALGIESCRARLDAFVDAGSGIDARAACTDACSLTTLALRPSLADDGATEVRPWIEVTPWGSNLPDGVELAEALRCAVPQGIAGCEFTSPLGNLARALARTHDTSDPAYPFLRPGADLLIVVVSAGNDCSLAVGHDAHFVDEEVFWGELQLPDLTPAICWRAGVVCQGPGPVYDGCAPGLLGDDGQPTGPEQAVLTPVQSVGGALEALRDEQQKFNADAQVTLFSVAGVPAGYPEGQPIVYADADDPEFQRRHGIGPGCADTFAAPPPVRLLAAGVDVALDGFAAESICRDDWSDSFTRLAAAADEHMRPTCYPKCVLDSDRDTPTLEPMCEFAAVNTFDPWRTSVPVCVREGDAWVAPGGSTRCVVLRSGSELSPECVADGSNLEVEVVLTAADPPGTVYHSACRLSDDKARDCPLL